MSANFEVIEPGPYSLGEGCHWDARNDRLIWIDINGKSLMVRSTAGLEKFDLPGMPGTVVLTSDPSEVILALDGGIASFNLESGNLVTKAEFPEGPEMRFNDGKCDPSGRLWVGTMHRDGKAGAGTLYRIDPDFSIHPMLRDLTIPNGICWNAEATELYFIESATRVIAAFDFDNATGTISSQRTIIEIPDLWGYPDGMTIDSEGLLWVAHWDGGCIARYAPETGNPLTRLELPVPKVTSCWFGGADLKTLYITTALGSQDGGWADTERFPLSGAVFAADVGASGLPASHFGGS